MNRNAATIANFVCSYFRFMSEIVRLINTKNNGDSFIYKEDLEILAQRDEVPIENLLKLRIAKLEDNLYLFDKRVTSFVAFCNNEFALSSPEAVKKYHFSLDSLYKKFVVAKEANDIVTYAEYIISELIDFSDMLKNNLSRLLDDTLRFKEKDSFRTPKERFDAASKLIYEYVEPLKEIVEDREDTILPLIRNIISIAMLKRVSYDTNIDDKLYRLWKQGNITHENIESFGKKIVTELFTLRKIQKNNLILSGAITWLKHYHDLPESNLAQNYRLKIHSKEFIFEAIEEFEDMLNAKQTIHIPSKSEMRNSKEKNSQLHFHFNEEIYLKSLMEELPIKNFFIWLYKQMDKNNELTFSNFCTALSMMDHLHLKFTEERDRLDFGNFYLNIPVVIAKKVGITNKEEIK